MRKYKIKHVHSKYEIDTTTQSIHYSRNHARGITEILS
jgi:hypothetical protein